MNLPKSLEEKITALASKMGSSKARALREDLTKKYKVNGVKDVIKSEDESIVYALCRMPATYSVCYTLISGLVRDGYLKGVSSVIDIGTGTGSVYFSLKALLDGVNITCYEKEKLMAKVFHELSGEMAEKLDISKEKIDLHADLVTASYVFSELDEGGKKFALKSMFEAAEKYMLIVDTGTPKTYEDFMVLKSISSEYGFKVTAPCMSEECLLKNDYCQFYARVERSSILRQSKSATKPYEDEKYFYLLFEKTDVNAENKAFARVIRRPVYRRNLVELMLCKSSGAKKQIVTKKDREIYKLAKELKINEVTDKVDGN